MKTYDVYIDYIRDDVIEVQAETMDEAERKAERIAEKRLKDGEIAKVTGVSAQLEIGF